MSEEISQQVDDALGLQMISIRLRKELIEEFKVLANFAGIGYQPLMREALEKFAASEFKRIATEYVAQIEMKKERKKASKS